MAEIARSLTAPQAFVMYPVRELCQESASQVYEAVGKHLIDLYEKDVSVDAEAFLVTLDNGQEVAFQFAQSVKYKQRQEAV